MVDSTSTTTSSLRGGGRVLNRITTCETPPLVEDMVRVICGYRVLLQIKGVSSWLLMCSNAARPLGLLVSLRNCSLQLDLTFQTNLTYHIHSHLTIFILHLRRMFTIQWRNLSPFLHHTCFAARQNSGLCEYNFDTAASIICWVRYSASLKISKSTTDVIKVIQLPFSSSLLQF